MKYINTLTGVTIDVDTPISGTYWQEERSARVATPKKKTAKQAESTANPEEE